MGTHLLTGGRIYSPASPDATAMAVTDGTVVWVGADHVGRALHPDAQIIDLAGAFVAPAFVDSHVHLTSTGLSLDGLDLAEVTDRESCLRALAAYCDRAPEGELIWGLGWDDSAWPIPGPPTTAEIDAIAGGRPVYLARIDEHSAAASSSLRALVDDLETLPGFDPDQPLTAEAHHQVRGRARALITPAAGARAARRALDDALAHGIVAVHENGGPDISGLGDFAALATIDHPVLIRRYWGQLATDADHARELMSATGADALGGDLFVDGAIGSHTAFLSSPYTDDPAGRGVNYIPAEAVLAHLRACTAAGVQAGFHIIGDAATDIVATALDTVVAEFGSAVVARCAHRVEHAEMVTRAQAASLAAAGVTASMQPLFDALWGGPGDLYEQRLGAERVAGMNDFAGLAREGVNLSFSSDSPVTSMRPWETIRAAAHHHDPESAVSPRAAFAACTRGGWRAGGVNDGVSGTLVPGAPAHYAVWDVDDLVVAASSPRVQRWSTDPRSGVPPLPDVSPGAALPRCLRTVSAGAVVYDTGALDAAETV
ncbi:amidohydrolase [Gordonia jinhuaensis]|nr:amidohydrolase family protein [Gordonia jinhuaensis]